MLNMACPDSRIRGALLYHGASTGRWAGRGIQPQNYPQGKIKDVHNIISALETGDYQWFQTLFPDVFTALSAALRAMLCAPYGHDLISCDFSAIEARVVCWLAGDEVNLDVYRKGLDPYKEMASAIFNVSTGAVKQQRELGKRAVLGCGFGMGWKKFMLTCEVQGQPVSEELAQAAVNAYRYKYEPVKAFWNDLEEAAIRAVKYAGRRFDVNEVQWLVKGAFLYCRLPSGRLLAYYAPKIERRDSPMGERDQLTYMAVDSKTKQWVREGTYGGKLTENVVQATARDVMVDAMFRVERAGYPLVLSVHDELVADVPQAFGSLNEFEQIMSELPHWAKGLPIKVEGWRSDRYKK
jgi:DNA polymerase